jgi:hypothetical protein
LRFYNQNVCISHFPHMCCTWDTQCVCYTISILRKYENQLETIPVK